MDYEKLIKKEFKFLKAFGFKINNNTRNFEIEIDFLKDEINIGLNYVSYNNQVVGCGISVADKHENILKNTIFDRDETVKLNELVSNSASAVEQIKTYAQFISQNIGKLLNYNN